MDFFIQSDYAIDLNEIDWLAISNLTKNFKTKFYQKRSHEDQYYKNKLAKSPYGKSIVTRLLNKNNDCLGLITLTRKSFLIFKNEKVSYELGDVYIIHELQGKNIFKDISCDWSSYR